MPVHGLIMIRLHREGGNWEVHQELWLFMYPQATLVLGAILLDDYTVQAALFRCALR